MSICTVCGSKLEFCGQRPVYDRNGNIAENMTEQMYQLLYYCKSCNANIEYTKLLSD